MAMISPLNWFKAFILVILCFSSILILKWWKISYQK